ncbi:hypothetical protein GCM10010869_05790 [Mesorhizobium tianshanense]|uniref:Integrase-like protein n=1 Tax=Mesorhizobium tianshanense TaxID=39844 RepID=A0A562NLQ4_9HYPH|nr:integrase-like protein [Mesorhizobium tianshanense]GLS34991.1 hypothetical protein GCM10010869_05790 [Mesorhizobium tianshanense]
MAVLGASSLSYAEARWSETLPDWLGCHVNALEAFGGAPALLVPDNAKVAIIKACRYDPQVNRTYAGMAEHYGSSVLPTRPQVEYQKGALAGDVASLTGFDIARAASRALSRDISLRFTTDGGWACRKSLPVKYDGSLQRPTSPKLTSRKPTLSAGFTPVSVGTRNGSSQRILA